MLKDGLVLIWELDMNLGPTAAAVFVGTVTAYGTRFIIVPLLWFFTLVF